MFDLDRTDSFEELDSQNMLAQIDGLPGQLEAAWKLGLSQALPEIGGIRQVIVAGMGGSAIGADLLAAYVAPMCTVPVIVHRDYGLPAWAAGPETLVIASSHSGNTEETLSSFAQAREQGCSRMAIATGGRLAQLAGEEGVPLWTFTHEGQPRAAVGFSFGLLMAAFVRLGLIPDQQANLEDALSAMRSQQTQIQVSVPAARNMAKRIAGQLIGRWVTVMGSGLLAPVSRRWKGQISEVAKAWAQFEFLPEADHNTLAGIMNPEELFPRMIILFLQAPSDHPRNRLRSDLTRKGFMLEGFNTDVFTASGSSPLAHQWTALHFGDYVAYYLAMAYNVDPTPIPAIENLKREMSAPPQSK